MSIIDFSLRRELHINHWVIPVFHNLTIKG